MLPHRDVLQSLNENLSKKKNEYEFDPIPIVPQDPRAKGWTALNSGQYSRKFVLPDKESLCEFCKDIFQYMKKNIMIDFTINVKKGRVLVILGSDEMISELELQTAKEINYIYDDILESR